MNNKLKLLIFLGLLIFSRLVNIENTSRFLWDESSTLVGIHQYWVEKKLSFIGPTSQDGTEVFSSLTYYLLLPAAVLGSFSPYSIGYGAAFLGVVAGILLFFLSLAINKKLSLFIAVLAILWYPLLETGRWPWNPNFIPMWTFLALLLFFKKKWWSVFLSGFFFGLTIHQHFLAAFSLAGFNLAYLFWCFKSKNLKFYCWFLPGEILAIIPFFIFDLLHPPGLFLTQVLYFNHLNEVGSFIYNPTGYFFDMLNYFTQNKILALFLGVSSIILLINDIKRKSFALIFASGWILHILLLPLVKDSFYHYLIPAVGFFVIWLIYPRKIESLWVKISLVILIISSLFSFYPTVTKQGWETDKKLVLSVADIIQEEIKKQNLQNVNIATLESPDINTVSQRYRDILALKNFYLDDKFKYSTSDYLFVLSTSFEDKIRRTSSPEMDSFRNANIIKKWGTSNPNWVLYLFKK